MQNNNKKKVRFKFEIHVNYQKTNEYPRWKQVRNKEREGSVKTCARHWIIIIIFYKKQ